MTSRIRSHLLAPLFGLILIAGPVGAQNPTLDLGRTQVTRGALDSLLTELEAAANSPIYSDALRERSRRQAAQIRLRLSDGDFQIGDRVRLQVVGETALTDTFSVQAGRVLDLPNVGRISVRGALRTELRDTLERYLRVFFRDPVISVQPLIRVSVLGEVRNQGFYTVPVDILVEGLMNIAGGPSPTANLKDMRIERGDEVLWDEDELERAITRGVTLDVLNIQSGDRMVVGMRRNRSALQTTQTIGMLLSLPLTAYALLRFLF